MTTERTSRRRSPLLIIKLGGSLAGSPALRAWLDGVVRHGAGRAVIVPGGGRFADAVRMAQARWRFSDAAAHDMALLAMEQFGLMLCALDARLCAARSRADIRRALADRVLPVWLPSALLARAAGVRKNWDVTSDSLAAWLARELRASHLVLVKSCRVPRAATVAALARAGIVDRELPRMIRGAGLDTRVVGRSDYGRLSAMLDSSTGATAAAPRVAIARRTSAMRIASSSASRRLPAHSAPRKPR
jgi:aspartokinase-like uncharacterized kinase